MTKRLKLVTESGLYDRMQNVIDEAAWVTTRKRHPVKVKSSFSRQSCLGHLLPEQ
jgi:hypothetical protein